MRKNVNNLPILEDSPDAIEHGAPRYLTKAATDKPEMPAHFHRINERGLLEVVDMHTGRILCVQTSAEDLLLSKWERLVRIDTPQGPVYLEKGLSFDLVPRMQSMPYSKVLADLVCAEIAQGKTFIEAIERFNIPYNIAIQWKREQEEFRLALKQAKRDRAEYLHDEVLDTARNHATAKDKIAALQWAAERGDPDEFGKQTKVTKEHKGAITFIVSTGITRPGDQGYVEVSPPTREVGPLRSPDTGGEAEEVTEYSGGSESDS